MLAKAENSTKVISALIFGASLLILYSASTLYHAAKEPSLRSRLRIFDHAAIYVLIAGTYTPVCLITLSNGIGTTLLYIIWLIAIGGVILKLFFTGRFDRISTILYIAMGWIAIFAISPLFTYMSTEALIWMLSGGIFYTTGAILYSIRRIPFNHAIFHFFVLGGSFSHFVMVYYFIF